MSLLDQVRKLEEQVLKRLRELEPLVREHEQLRAVAERLGVKYSPSPGEDSEAEATAATDGERAPRGAARPAKRRAAKPAAKRANARKAAAKPRPAKPAAAADAGQGAAKRAAKPRAARGNGRRATAARPGQRQEDVLRLVGEQPGITVRELGERLGVDATGLYRATNPLSAEGRGSKDRPRLQPVETASAGTPTPARAR